MAVNNLKHWVRSVYNFYLNVDFSLLLLSIKLYFSLYSDFFLINEKVAHGEQDSDHVNVCQHI